MTASAGRVVVRRARGIAAPRSASGPFWGLMFFSFVLYVSPQMYLGFLRPLRLGLVSGGVAIILYLLDRIFRGGTITVTIPPIKLVLLLYVLAAASIPTSMWPGGSFEILTGDLWKSVLIFLLLGNVVDTLPRMKLLIGSLAVWGSIMAVSAARDFSEGITFAGRIAGYESALAGNPNDLAFTLNLMMAVILGLFFATRKLVHRVLLAGAMVIMTWGVITTFSRAGFLTLMAMGVVVMIERIRKGDTLSVLGVIGLAVCLVVISPAGYGNRIYSIVDFDADPTGSARGRYEGMFQAVEMIAERPVLGYGLGMNGLGVVERGGGWSVVHNAFLQVGTDLGVAGMIVFVLIFIQLLRGVNATIKELRLRSGNADLLALASGVRLALLAYLVGAFFHPAAYHFYFFYSAGLAVAVQNLARVLSTGPESPARRPRGALGADPRRRWIIPTSPVQAKSTLR